MTQKFGLIEWKRIFTVNGGGDRLSAGPIFWPTCSPILDLAFINNFWWNKSFLKVYVPSYLNLIKTAWSDKFKGLKNKLQVGQKIGPRR